MCADAISRADSRRGFGLITSSAVLWGTVGVAGQFLYNTAELSPLTVGTYRMLITATLLTGLRVISGGGRAIRVTRGDIPAVLLVGAGLAIYQVCYFAAVKAAGVSVATLVTLGLAPVLVAVGSAAFQRERPDRTILIALASALAGLGLLVGLPAQEAGAGRPWRGAVLALGSASGYAGVTLLSRALAGRVEARELTMFGFAAGAGVLLPVAAVNGMSLEPSLSSWGLLLYLGVVPSAVAYGLFFSGIRMVKATVAAILTLLEPLTAAALAALLFGERLGVPGMLGGALLFLAVLLLYAARGGAATRSGSRQLNRRRPGLLGRPPGRGAHGNPSDRATMARGISRPGRRRRRGGRSR